MLAKLLLLRSLLLALALLLLAGAGLVAAVQSGWLPAQGALAATAESCRCRVQWQLPRFTAMQALPAASASSGAVELEWECFSDQLHRGGLRLSHPALTPARLLLPSRFVQMPPHPRGWAHGLARWRGWQLRWWSETKQIAALSPQPAFPNLSLPNRLLSPATASPSATVA